MATEPAPPACPNPACDCDPCACPRPCTCGLTATRRSSHEVWDPVRNEYRHIEIHTFVPEAGHRAPAAAGGDHGDHAGHAAHGGHADHSGHAAPAQHDEATTDLVGSVERFDPDEIALTEVQRRAAQVAAHQHAHQSTSIRRAEHNGHTIEIVTSYELRIDGEPLRGHMGVNADGTVHYHGIPNYSTESAVDLMKQVVDSFPDDYVRPARPPRVETDDRGGE